MKKWLAFAGAGALLAGATRLAAQFAQQPTPPSMDSNYTYQKVIILLTDGLNTENRWYTDQTSIDARQQLTCTAVKAAGITVYTVQVNTGGDPTSTLPSSFFSLPCAKICTSLSSVPR